MTPREEQDCLNYDPFAGDETQVRLLADRFVRVRRPHRCNVCWHDIRAGMRVRARTEINLEGRHTVGTFHFCIQCCEAMARADDDNGRSIEHRTGMGMKKAGSLPWDA